MRSLRRQRGFIYLTTGANGTGKTLLTLKDVRAKQVKENRPVYYNGFDLKPEKEVEFGWQKFDPVKWQDLPDGSICIMDECQDQFPVRGTGAKVPDHVEKLAVHRKRGFDFYMVTQHPANIDKFIVRLVGDPGWHRHLKRSFGQELTSVLQWSAVNLQCEKPSSGKSGTVSMVPYPREVYEWYRSSSLHTAKKKIPRAVWVVLAGVLGVPLLGYFAWQSVASMGAERAARIAPAAVEASAPAGGRPDGGYRSSSATVLSTEDYLASYTPRIAGLPHTAPRFDAVTTPVQAPYPAACIVMRDECRCYTNQATRLDVQDVTCRSIAERGFFVEWQQAPGDGERAAGARSEPVAVRDSVGGVLQPPASLNGERDGQVIRSMRDRRG